MVRQLNWNIAGPSGALPKGTTLAVDFFSDRPASERPYYAGTVEEDGRFIIRVDGPDPVNDTGTNLTIIAPGCKPFYQRGLMQPGEQPVGIVLEAGANPFRSRPTPPPPAPRRPLPPFPAGSYDRDFSRIWPTGAPKDRRFLRADLWGVTIPSLPFVPGGSSEHPERMLTWFLDRWDRDWRERGLYEHAIRGYTHFYLSWPDSHGPRNNGPWSPPGNEQSLQQFVETCGRVHEWFYCGVFLGSKYFDPRDQSAQQWADRVGPVLEALINADVVDEFVPAWEMDLFNVPGRPTIDYTRFVGGAAHAAGKGCYLHFSTEKTSWFADGDPRGRYGFWDDIRGYCDGLNYQADSAWDIGELQARCVDSLIQVGRQPWWDFRAFELQASAEFSQDHPDEDDADLTGYLSLCTAGQAKVYGFGNGARMPDGSVL